jgi:antibiotic biosynthesis monooxygenase (ABM) superfamily enzyme
MKIDAPGASDNAKNETVTVVVTRLVKPGKEADYEQWLRRLITNASSLPGYLGTDVHRPTSGGSREYTSVFRFDSVANLRAFEASDLRRQALRDVADFVEANAAWKEMTGLEFWFTPPPGTVVPQPSRLRMALLMIVVVYGLVLSIGTVVALLLKDAPMPVRLLVTITIEVFLMTYVLMPRITRWLAKWIYPQKRSD